MKNRLFYLFLLFIPFCVRAQKAYDVIQYKGALPGKTILLYLGNGYVAASRITFLVAPKQKSISFLPESGVGSDKFILRNSKQTAKDYFTLYNIRETYEKAPAIINGLYCTDKKTIPVKFYHLR